MINQIFVYYDAVHYALQAELVLIFESVDFDTRRNWKHHLYVVFTLRQAALDKRASIEEVELYFNLSEKVRHFTEDYFQLETPLYFSYSHLVCRTSVAGKFLNYSFVLNHTFKTN